MIQADTWKSVILAAAMFLLVSPVAADGIEIVEPQDGATATQRFVPLHVDVDTVVQNLTYSVNGVYRGQCDCVQQSKPVRTREGDNTVAVRAEDANTSQVYTDSVQFMADTKPPSIDRIRPRNEIYSRTPTIQASYSDTASGIDEQTVNVTLDGQPLARTATSEGFTVNIEDELDLGPHTLHIDVADLQGHTVSEQAGFTISREPRFSANAPTGILTRRDIKPQFQVQSVSPLQRDSLRLQILGISEHNYNYDRIIPGSQLVRDGGNNLSFTGPRIHLPADGTFQIRVQQRRNDSFDTKHSWKFSIDTYPPDVHSFSLNNTEAVSGTEEIKLQAGDAVTSIEKAWVAVDSFTAALEQTGDNTFRTVIDFSRFGEGMKEANLSVEDTVGNTRHQLIDLAVDNTAPRFQEVTVGPRPAYRAIYINGSIRENQALQDIRYSVHGEDSDGRIGNSSRLNSAISLPSLPAGQYTLTVTARDVAGNEEAVNRTFTVSDSLPSIGITAGSNITITNSGESGAVIELSFNSTLPLSLPRKEFWVLEPGEERTIDINMKNATGNHVFTVAADRFGTSTTVAESTFTISTEENNSLTGTITGLAGSPWTAIFLFLAGTGFVIYRHDLRSIKEALQSSFDRFHESFTPSRSQPETTAESGEKIKVSPARETCDRCGQGFSSKQDLRLHVNKEH